MVDAREEARRIVDQVWRLVEPVVRLEGMELAEIEYRRENTGWVLRLYVDRKEGVTIDDCARVNRVIGDLLDVADPIDHPYNLEISSPGLNRPLRKREHFERAVGCIIRVIAAQPIDNRKKFKGILVKVEPESIAIDCDGRIYHIPLALIERARLRYFESQQLD